MTEEVEQHDLSRLDAYARSRQKVAFLNAVWRPMAAGAVGAALVIAAVYVTLPKFATREVLVDHVTPRDVAVDRVVPKDVPVDRVVPYDVAVPHIVPHDVPVDHIVPHDTPVDRIIPHDAPVDHIVPHDVAVDRVVPLPSPTTPAAGRPLTPDESGFAARPEYQDAPYHGRIVESRGGGALSFEDGQDFFPAHADRATGKTVMDPQNAFDADPFVGDLGLCRPDQGLWRCVALHRGKTTPVTYKRGRPA